MFRRIIKSHKLNLSYITEGPRERNYGGTSTSIQKLNFGSLNSFTKNSSIPSMVNNNHGCKLYKMIGASFSTNQRSEVYLDKLNGFPSIENGDDPKKEEILNQDTELRSLLADIMKDFDAGPSMDPPGCKATATVNEKSSIEDSDNGVIAKLEKGAEDNDSGTTGSITSVFSLKELVNLLQDEKLKDIAVIKIPDHLAYCNYLVLATAFSIRHLKASTEMLLKTYKAKKRSQDPYLTVEGKECNDWKVIDMNTIVLHLFTADVREHYDIETLWTVGEKFDDLSNEKQNKVEELLDQHTYYFDDVKTAVNGQ